MQKQGKSHIL